ncbi:MAG: CBS domain-containing protein, partial [Bacteroidota bacterium]
MTLPFKKIREKLLAGDFSGLFRTSTEKVNIHPSEVANLFISIPSDKAIDAFRAFQQEQQVAVLPYLDIQLQKKIIRSLPKEKASAILNKLSSDDRAIFYSSLKGIELSTLLDYLDHKNRSVLHSTLGYPDQSVARIINTDFAAINKDLTIGEANEHLRKYQKDTEAANVIYIVDKDGRLIDDIPVRRMVLTDPAKKIEDILDGFCPSLKITDSKEDAVLKFKEYDRIVLPVTNADNILLGVVTIDDV